MNTPPFLTGSPWETIFAQLAAQAGEIDRQALWPGPQLRLLADTGVFAWDIPQEFQGMPVTPRRWAEFYLDCTAACLTTSFIFSQRNAAVSRLVASENKTLKQELLPQLATGELFTTVGISHLSTSRQHLGRPAVSATETATGYELSGTVPWVTGGPQADLLVTGGTLADGRQILAVVPRATPGVTIAEPIPMLALTATATGMIELQNVVVPHEQVLAGPVENVMKSGGGGTGSLTTSTLALGLAGRAIQALADEAARRENLLPESQQLTDEWQRLVSLLLTAEEQNQLSQPEEIQSLRARANSIVLRAAQAYLTAVKGSGFVSGHLAERTIREAMFFLVWSCPQPVAQAAMKEFACTPQW